MFLQHKYSVTLPFQWNTLHKYTLNTTQIPTANQKVSIYDEQTTVMMFIVYKAYENPPNRIVYKSLK